MCPNGRRPSWPSDEDFREVSHVQTHTHRLLRRHHASPGNRQPNYIAVSVADANGAPVAELAAANFKVDPMIVGAGGALVSITGVSAGRLPGFYHVNVVPINTETWKAGVYIRGRLSEVQTKGRLSLLF